MGHLHLPSNALRRRMCRACADLHGLNSVNQDHQGAFGKSLEKKTLENICPVCMPFPLGIIAT